MIARYDGREKKYLGNCFYINTPQGLSETYARSLTFPVVYFYQQEVGGGSWVVGTTSGGGGRTRHRYNSGSSERMENKRVT